MTRCRISLALVFALIAALLTVSPRLQAADPKETAEALPDPSVVVRRTTLIVSDMERSIAFYRDIMGYQTWLDRSGTITEKSVIPTTAGLGEPSRIAIMKGRDPWVGMVGLLQFGNAVASSFDASQFVASPGDIVLMMETREIEGIYQRMLVAQTPILRPLKSQTVTGADGITWVTTNLFAFDPDGHLLEISQRDEQNANE